MLRLLLPRNQFYTIVVKCITSSTHLSLNSVHFSELPPTPPIQVQILYDELFFFFFFLGTYDVQDLRVRFENELKTLQITFYLAAGAITQGFTVHLMRENYTLLQTSFNISQECGQVPFQQSCAVNRSITFPQHGNFTLFVLGWEQNQGIISDYVYSVQEFTINIVNEVPSIKTHTDATTSKSTNAGYNNITELKTTYTQSAILIISGEWQSSL